MTPGLLTKYRRPVPRYTSYPTAPQMHPGIGAQAYAAWLRAVPVNAPLSLYLHIPFCDSLCWFCGCHTKVVARYQPIADYLVLLEREIELTVAHLGAARPVTHLHLGGGSPTMLSADDLLRLGDRLRARFDIRSDAEFAVEIDPRGLDRERIAALARIGVTRASIGVQDVNPKVQQAINRIQPFEVTSQAVSRLREAGISSINVDLMYGLPQQNVDDMCRTVAAAVALGPQRLALFGYAHVPWMKRHQRLIAEAKLPRASTRLAQFVVAAGMLEDAGYAAIGLDHFALPDDPLAIARREGRLQRNFQGYTTDIASSLLGFGPSAIGALPQGMVQNAIPIHAWDEALESGQFAVARGLTLDAEDRLRGSVIEQLMCQLQVDLAPHCRHFGRPADHFAPELEMLERLEADGLVAIDGTKLEVPNDARPFLRTVCATFDQYLQPCETGHARAV